MKAAGTGEIQLRRSSMNGFAWAWRISRRNSAGLLRTSSSMPYIAPMPLMASAVVGEP